MIVASKDWEYLSISTISAGMVLIREGGKISGSKKKLVSFFTIWDNLWGFVRFFSGGPPLCIAAEGKQRLPTGAADRSGWKSIACSESDKSSCFPGERTPLAPVSSPFPAQGTKINWNGVYGFWSLENNSSLNERKTGGKIFSMQFSKPYVRKSTWCGVRVPDAEWRDYLQHNLICTRCTRRIGFQQNLYGADFRNGSWSQWYDDRFPPSAERPFCSAELVNVMRTESWFSFPRD